MKKYLLIFCIAYCFVLNAAAQTSNLIFEHINRASGLPLDEVTCLAQDSMGFIWIGSKEGLFRFDGFNYKGFYHIPGNQQTIPSNYISKLHIDKTGLLWIGTSAGVAIMKNSGRLIKVINAETDKMFTKNAETIFDIKEDKNFIWISTGDGLFSINKNDRKLHVTTHDFSGKFKYSTNQLGAFFIDNKGMLWICTLHGLVIYDPVKRELFHSGNNPASLTILIDKTPFRSIAINEAKKTIWYSTWEPGVFEYNMSHDNITTIYSGKHSANPNYEKLINQFLVDDHGFFWMATGEGINILDNNQKTPQHILHKPGNVFSIYSNSVSALLQDKEGIIWAGTSEGLSITNPYKQSVFNISANNVEEYPYASSAVNVIIPVLSNSFLIGTGNGIYRTDSTFKVLQHYRFGTNKYDWIWKYFRFGDSIIISAQGGNLVYDISTQQLKKLTDAPFDKFYPISSFKAGKDGFIWMSQYMNNFLQYNPLTMQYKKYSLADLGEESSVILLEKDNENNTWVLSSNRGVFKFDEAKRKFTERWLVDSANGLLDSHILFLKDIGEYKLIGYVTKGISLYDKKKKTFRHFSRADGLVSNSVTDAIQTSPGTVWITTRNGISRFDLSSASFTNYGYDNGILQNDFDNVVKLPDGRLAAGNKKGLVYFFPHELIPQEKIAAPVITQINVYGLDVPVDSFSVNHPLQISYNKNYLSFEYISLQYQNNQQIEYAYMLEGFDKNWVPAGNRRFASYSNITGGNYNLRIKARLPGGEWVENKMQLPVIVQIAFYKQIWFYIACAFLIVVISYIVFQYRLKQLMRLEKMRASISSDLHDEVGATLTSISIFSEMAKQSVPDDSKAEPFLQRIGDRSRDSIEKMSDIIWSINPENDSLQQMLTRMKNFVNEIVEGKDIAVHWEEEELISSLKLGMEERKNFYLLFKEAAINAVKYADAKNITVKLAVHKKMVFLEVKDDGKGFDFNTIKQGNGIKNIKKRAILLKGKATIQSTPGKGTRVHVEFQH